jgi:hypothetical protein
MLVGGACCSRRILMNTSLPQGSDEPLGSRREEQAEDESEGFFDANGYRKRCLGEL